MRKELYRLEDYGLVKHDQSEFLNDHLQSHLEEFNKQYIRSGGDINSLNHELMLNDFAELAGESIIQAFSDVNGSPSSASTKTSLDVERFGVTINVSTETTWEPA